MTNTICELPDCNPPSGEITDLLRKCRTIAVVGLSPKESRDSNRVARYLIKQGYKIIPVNPGQKEILGQPCFTKLEDIPFHIDIANLFLNPARVPQVVDQAISAHVSAIWMQEGVVHNVSAGEAGKAGIRVVMNRCIMKEHMKLTDL